MTVHAVTGRTKTMLAELHCGGRHQRSVSPGKYISTARILPAKKGRREKIWGHMCIKKGGLLRKKRKSLMFVLNGFVDCALFPESVLRPHFAG